MNHERVPASYWLHAHGSSKASTAWRDVGWQTRQKNAHALSHSGRKGGVRRRETVGVGHAGGRARARHIYRAAAHGHAAHIAHKRSLRPRRACELSRGGGGRHTQLPRARAATDGASLARGVAYAARAPSMHLLRPLTPPCDADVALEGHPPRLRGGRRRDPHDAGGACADSHSGRGGT